jgi:hypothetical protein
MHLKDLKRQRNDGAYVGTVADSIGDAHYELVISGSSKLIQKVFAESEFEHLIDPKAAAKEWVTRNQEMWERNTGTADGEKGPETIVALDKGVPVAATAKNSIVVSIRRTEGQGTGWGFWFPLLALPVGANLYFVLPPICNCWGVTVPLDGDPDLFLSANHPYAPVIASSRLGGLRAIDRVSFGPIICWPWEQFVPWFRVNAYSTCLTGFGLAGLGVFP